MRSGEARNIIVQSKNGTGKTLAEATVLISRLGKETKVEQTSGEGEALQISALILTSTREIAIQTQ